MFPHSWKTTKSTKNWCFCSRTLAGNDFVLSCAYLNPFITVLQQLCSWLCDHIRQVFKKIWFLQVWVKHNLLFQILTPGLEKKMKIKKYSMFWWNVSDDSRGRWEITPVTHHSPNVPWKSTTKLNISKFFHVVYINLKSVHVLLNYATVASVVSVKGVWSAGDVHICGCLFGQNRA